MEIMLSSEETLSVQKIIMNRVHMLSFLLCRESRDVLAKINFFHIKEQLIHSMRQTVTLPDPYSGITLYAYFTQATILAHKSPIIKLLRNHKLLYRWEYRIKLLISRDGVTQSAILSGR